MEKILVKVHNSYRNVVAVCDAELLGKKFEDDLRQIELTQHFFGGDEKSTEEVSEIFEEMKMEDATFFIVGSRSVAIAKEKGIVTNEGIGKIGEVEVGLVLM